MTTIQALAAPLAQQEEIKRRREEIKRRKAHNDQALKIIKEIEANLKETSSSPKKRFWNK